MKVFISWSGPRSRYVAEQLRNWLPKALQAVKPWMSAEDISLGTRWAAELAGELEQTKVGIICLTPENQSNPWVMFEAGALSKTIQHAYVCPYLIDISFAQLSGPLAQFQAAPATRDGTYRLLQTLNRALDSDHIPDSELEDIFNVWWPRLEQQLNLTPTAPSVNLPHRTPDEMLEELVNNTREQLRREEVRLKAMDQMEGKFGEAFANFEIFTAQLRDYSTNYSTRMKGLFEALSQSSGVPDSGVLQAFTDALPGDGPSESLMGNLQILKELQSRNKQTTKELLERPEDNAENSPSNS